MKKCPFCKAEIEENARFCLYCMTPFEEKTKAAAIKTKDKRWRIYLAALLVFALILGSAFIIFKDGDTASGDKKVSSSSFTSLKGIDVSRPLDDDSTSTQAQKENSSYFDLQGGDTTHHTTSGGSSSSYIQQSDASTSHPQQSGAATSSLKQSGSSTSSLQSENGGAAANSSSKASSTTPNTGSATYIYRAAEEEDVYGSVTTTDVKPNEIVISGIKTASENGVYNIPSTIDGKKVVAIASGAFYDVRDTVKTVIVPTTVRAIGNNNFYYCLNMTDLYLCGAAVYTDWGNCFPNYNPKYKGVFTVHCSAECHDRNFRKFKNYILYSLNETYGDYSIAYKEWNYSGD